jgi:hypothetical protein
LATSPLLVCNDLLATYQSNVASVGVHCFSLFREISPALGTATQSKKLLNSFRFRAVWAWLFCHFHLLVGLCVSVAIFTVFGSNEKALRKG